MKKTVIIILSVVLLLGIIIPVTLAWLNDSTLFEVSMDSYVHKSYFESGDGTSATHYSGSGDDEGCAFEIKHPVQLYYFAWLQYLGYFNKPVGDSTTIDQVYFWVSEDLDMTGWVLPPIGTTEYPFVGNFDGNGKTISNLTIQNVTTTSTSTITDLPVNTFTNAEIIGFFGVVGSLNSSGTVNGAVDTNGEFVATAGYTYSSAINEIKDFTIDGVTVKTETNNALIGALAGYVNGTVSRAAVADTDIVVDSNTGVLTYTQNISDYSLVGYCTDAAKFTLNVSKVTLHAPGETHNLIYKNVQAEGAGFGGSIKMSDLFTRLTNVRTNLSSRPTTPAYPTNQTWIRNANGDIINKITTATATPDTTRRYYASDGSGMYYYYNTNNTFLYMYQETMTVLNITKTGETKNGYTISDGTHYLNLNTSANGVTDTGETTKWVYENNRIYTYNEADGNIYYLNANNNNNGLTVSTTASTSWTWNNNHFSYTSNGTTYYLHYENGWTVIAESYYVIGDGKGNYLRYNNGLTNTTTPSQATHWEFSNTGTNPSGYISTTVGNTTYYLRYYDGLTTTTSTYNRTSWSNNGTSIYNGSNYIKFDGSDWVAGPLETYYAIHSGSNYLNITAVSNNTATLGTGTNIADLYSSSGHTLWMFSTTGTNPSGTISTVVNGVTYYLNDDNGTLTATTTNNSSSWANNGSSLTCGTHGLSYSSGWTLTTLNQFTIRSGNYYLNITNNNGTLGTGNSVATGSVSNHTVWTISDSGQIYATANGNTYYLRNNNGTLSATTTNFTGWTVNGDQISNGGYYLYYNSGWKLSNTSLLGYTIDYDGNYLNMTSTSTNTNNPIGSGTNQADLSDNGHTIWQFDNVSNINYPAGRMFALYNGTSYYLYGSSNSAVRFATGNPTGNNYTWTNTNGVLRNTGRNRYLRWNTGGWFSDAGWEFSNTNSNNTLNFTPIYASVTLEASGAPSITVTSEQEVASSKRIQINITLTNITRNSATIDVLRNDGTTTENSEYASAFPINVFTTSPYAANPDTNTGYFVAGGYAAASSSGRGDLRVSQYSKSDIQTAFGGTTYTDARLEVITGMDNGTYSGWYRVSDSFNSANSNVSTAISNVVPNNRKIDYKTLGLKRYEDARQSLSDTFSGSSNIYGLHFMNSEIDINHYVTLPKAYIEGKEYDNFQVPNDSIDFHVKRRGFITVFAGTYFNGNDAFFSLHEIIRYKEDDPEVINGTKNVDDLKEIKEISQIYKLQVGSDFVYKYTDGTYSSSAARGDLAFDMKYMTDPTNLVQNAVYYFEIPVNEGEFALGSVAGHTGAYLFYLDIAANAGLSEDKTRVTITEKFKDESYSVVLPKGVQLVESGNSYDTTEPYAIVTVELDGQYSGTYPLERTGNTFIYTDDTHSTLTYCGEPIEAQTMNGNTAQTYTYYPNGYEIRYVEHILDKGLDTNNYDHFLVQTIDSFDTSGTRTIRTVKIYADIEDTEVNEAVDESVLEHIITFTYNPTGHDDMKTRVVRSASEGGFNIAFDQNLTLISNTIDSPNVHVNFGDNTASILVTATAAAPLAPNTTIVAVDMAGATLETKENTYYASVYGPELATYVEYYEGANVEVVPTTTITMAQLDPGNGNQNRNLTYAITLTPGTGVDSVIVYAKRLIDPSYTYTTKVYETAAMQNIVTSGTITVTPTVTLNGTTLTTSSTKITING